MSTRSRRATLVHKDGFRGPLTLRLASLADVDGRRVSPAFERERLAKRTAAATFADPKGGAPEGSHAAVWRRDEATDIVATTNFFMPIAKGIVGLSS